MRVSVRVSADDPYVPDDLAAHIGRVLPLRIGELAYASTLQAVEPVDGGYVLELELPDSDLRFEAWRQRVVVG